LTGDDRDRHGKEVSGMQVMGKGSTGKKGGKIEFLYKGKEGDGTMFLASTVTRGVGSRGSMRIHPSQLWHYSPQYHR
jgi:hypothetical protein